MITIQEFSIASDFKTMTLKMSTDEVTIDELYIYVGSDYLKPLPIDLSNKLTASASEDLTIILEDIGLILPTDVFDGIYTIYAVDDTAAYKEAAVANLYYVNLCLANMVILNNAVGGWNDINTIYMLILSIGIFIPAGKIEQALNSYERIIAMMENNPSYLIEADITPCKIGSGCWIINGTYVIN